MSSLRDKLIAAGLLDDAPIARAGWDGFDEWFASIRGHTTQRTHLEAIIDECSRFPEVRIAMFCQAHARAALITLDEAPHVADFSEPEAIGTLDGSERLISDPRHA